MPETYHAPLAILCVMVTLAALVRGRMASDLAMAGGIALLILSGVLTPTEAFAGLASPSIITIALLLVVSQGVIETGLVQWLGGTILGRGGNLTLVQLRLMAPVAAISAFINNTPLVAMCIPLVEDFARRTRIAPGKLFIPLAFAATLGGVCTLIGTSTNLVVHEMWLKSGGEPFHLFDLAPIGVPVALCGILYLMIAGRWLLPNSGREALATVDPRNYSVEMQVVGSPIAGKTVEQASLRGLEGLYLSEIRRGDEIIAPVGPTTLLAQGDTLIFIGDVRSVVSLQKMRGLAAAADQTRKLAQARHQRFLVEAVVSDSSPLLDRTIREARFRNTYDAVVIAVSRNGQRLSDIKIGSIELKAGDVLLLETQESFLKAFGESRDFLLVRRIEDSAPIRHERAPIAAAILAGVILVASFEPFGFTMLH
ncbi:MAG: SLC13 family permease, partial [bacterium]